MSSSIQDQMVINGCVLVTLMKGSNSLSVVIGEMIDEKRFMFDVTQTIVVVPGVPLRELLPLAEHELEIKGLLFDLV